MEVQLLISSALCFLLCFLCTVDSLSTSTLTSSAGNETDRLALLTFKDGIMGDPLGTLDTWNDSLHFCEWRGVTCSGQHPRVTTLVLESQRLSGSISPYLGNLSFLRVLNLQNNSFFGEIPQEISHLSRLKGLSLANNSLGGEIPLNLSHCSNLTYLSFSYNNLVGKVPEELGSLSKLKFLFLSVNNLTGHIPSSLGNLSSLYHLSIGFNRLEGSIPEALGRLTNLGNLMLAVNRLSGMVPPSLYNISSIYAISLSLNRIQGSLPQDIGLTLPNLQQLLIGSNQFTGPIPASLANASGFSVLSIDENNFGGLIPTSLGSLQNLSWVGVVANNLGNGVEAVDDLSFLTSLTNCSNLDFLAISYNHFGGGLPTSIANLSTKITSLILGMNQISGSIPTEIGNLVNLNILTFDENLFTGPMPVGIGKLQMLSAFTLEGNKLSGVIPSSLGNLTQLSDFSIANNNIRGSLPSSLQNCIHLQKLDVSQNNLNGTIPEQVFGLSSLSIYLNLSHNSFTGSLPMEVGSLKSLGVMDISENRLSGEIPKALGDCVSLEVLHLEGNLFQGNIPPSLISLKSLRYLDLSRNNLSGQIPKYLETLPFLQDLNLSFNSFEGDVPIKGVFRNASAISVVGNNRLCGGMSSLQLPACPIHKPKTRGGRSPNFRIIIAIVSVVLCLILMLSFLLYWRKKSSRKSLTSSSFGNSYLRVSYQELLKATDEFARANLIGVGSFGSVYKGILHQGESPVAVKVLNLQQRGASKSFVAECKVLRKIRHRNLLKIITSCSSLDFQGNDFKALVYEFMPNGSLEDWLHPNENDHRQLRNLSLEQRLNIAIDVASALDYLHNHCQASVVHCDLKPSNVLLGDDLTAHVGDFGLAKFLSMASSNYGEGHTTSTVAIKGSIGYVAPEYGMGSEVSTQGDVYSFGILLLEMFTGKRPTDDMFRDGLNLHNFAKLNLPEQVMEILDSHLLLEENFEEATNGEDNERITIGKMQECLVSIIRIGVACSAELPSDRININDVVMELHVIKNTFLEIKKRQI